MKPSDRCPDCYAMIRPGAVALISHRVSNCRPLPAAKTPRIARERSTREYPDRSASHGSYYAYIQGCRCDGCMEAKRTYQREYRARKKAA